MSILSIYHKAFKSGDIESLKEVLHDDCQFITHVGDTIFGKEDMIGIAGSDMVRTEGERILYENDEIGVDHCIAHFANGSTSEAVLTFYQFTDRKIIKVETGATPLSDDYQLVGSN
jgi:hypothetical protein